LITLIVDARPPVAGRTRSTLERPVFFEICPIAGG